MLTRNFDRYTLIAKLDGAVVAIEEIRRSAGRVRGLRLAFMDVVLCPTIAINVVLVIVTHILSIRVLHDVIRDIFGPGSSLVQAICSVFLSLLPIVGVVAQGVVTFRVLRNYWHRTSGPWPSEEAAAQRPRPEFCWKAAGGFVSVLLFLALLVTLAATDGPHFLLESSVYGRGIATLLFGVISCVIGRQALREIRESNGRLWGLGLAFFNAAAFPIVLLDTAIFGLVLLAVREFSGEGLLNEQTGPAALYSAPIWLIVDWLVLARKWSIEKSRAFHQSVP